MPGWELIKTAPKDTHILLYGRQTYDPDIQMNGDNVFSGYFDSQDGKWCGTSSRWDGPFYEPTHWQLLPEGPS
jgi:hypothetical protein